MMQSICGNCKWYNHTEEMPDGFGHCHLNPPQLSHVLVPVQQQNIAMAQQSRGLTLQDFTGWPVVKFRDFCGQYGPKITLVQ
jgi:hypothetical protein